MDIIEAPTLNQLEMAVEWLSNGPHPNLELENMFGRVLAGQIKPGQIDLLAIAHTTPKPLTPEHICGAVITSPNNTSVALSGSTQTTTEELLSLV